MALTGNDQTYSDIMNMVQNAKDQNSINAARNRLGELQGIGAGNATSTFSSILDKAQQGLAQPQTQPQIQVYDPTADIKAMAEAKKAAALAGLSKAHDKSLSDLSYAKSQIEPGYYNQRNSVSTDADIAKKNFAEYMASRGMTNSGTAAQSDIADNVALQGNLGNLATSEAKAYADNAKQVGDINTAFNNDIASTVAGIDATTMQDLINSQQQYNTQKLAQANTDRQFNYTTGRDTVLDNRYNDQFNYQKSQDALQQNNWQQQFDYSKASDAQKAAFNQAQFDYQKEQDTVNNTYKQGSFEWQKAMDQANLDLQRKQLAISQMKASSSSSASNGGMTSTQAKNDLFAEAQNYIDNADNVSYRKLIEEDKQAIINAFGIDTYNKLSNMYWNWMGSGY